MQLTEGGFENYRCDSNQVLGIQFAALNKILKCMTNKDSLSIQAQDEGDIINFIFESQDQKRYSNFELKLNDIDAEQLGIPDTDYGTTVKMPSGEFQRICRDLAAIGDTVTISATKQGVQFAVDGDIGAGSMMIKGFVGGRLASAHKVKDEDEDATQMDEEDEDMQMDVPTVGNVDDDGEGDEDDNGVRIQLEESVQQTFSLRYLNNFTKATGLSKEVVLRMGADVPLEVEYRIADFGSLRYYLAPKIDDDE